MSLVVTFSFNFPIHNFFELTPRVLFCVGFWDGWLKINSCSTFTYSLLNWVVFVVASVMDNWDCVFLHGLYRLMMRKTDDEEHIAFFWFDFSILLGPEIFSRIIVQVSNSDFINRSLNCSSCCRKVTFLPKNKHFCCLCSLSYSALYWHHFWKYFIFMLWNLFSRNKGFYVILVRTRVSLVDLVKVSRS